MNPLEMFYIVLLIIAVIIGFIIFTDTGLKWKDKD